MSGTYTNWVFVVLTLPCLDYSLPDGVLWWEMGKGLLVAMLHGLGRWCSSGSIGANNSSDPYQGGLGVRFFSNKNFIFLTLKMVIFL